MLGTVWISPATASAGTRRRGERLAAMPSGMLTAIPTSNAETDSSEMAGQQIGQLREPGSDIVAHRRPSGASPPDAIVRTRSALRRGEAIRLAT